MKDTTREKLHEAWDYCDDHDKSTPFMIQFMQDSAGVDHDCVMNFIAKTTHEQRKERWKRLGIPYAGDS